MGDIVEARAENARRVDGTEEVNALKRIDVAGHDRARERRSRVSIECISLQCAVMNRAADFVSRYTHWFLRSLCNASPRACRSDGKAKSIRVRIDGGRAAVARHGAAP